MDDLKYEIRIYRCGTCVAVGLLTEQELFSRLCRETSTFEFLKGTDEIRLSIWDKKVIGGD